MKRIRTAAVALVAAGSLAFAAPANAQDTADLSLEAICSALLGDQAETLDLSPLIKVDLRTCANARAPQSDSQSLDIDLGITKVRIRLF